MITKFSLTIHTDFVEIFTHISYNKCIYFLLRGKVVMKKIIGIFSAACILLQIIGLSVSAVSAEDELTINKKAKATAGDKVKYTLYLADTEEEIEGFEMQLHFDKDILKPVEDAFKFPNINGVVENEVGGDIYINWTNISNKLSFSDKKVFLSLEFNVISGGSTDITYFIKEMYGSNMSYLKKFTWTYDLAVNDEDQITGEAPLLTDIKHVKANNLQGAYINYEDGKGEENGGDGERKVVTDPDSDLLQQRDLEQQNMAGQTATVSRIISDIQDVTRVKEKDGEGGGGIPMGVMIGVGIVVLAALIIIAIPLSKRNKK